MTASTAPITLPARHRQEAPTWAFHVAVAWIVYAAALAVWRIRVLDARHGRVQTLFTAGTALMALAAVLAATGVILGALDL